MTAVVYKCPACGHYLADDSEKDILACPMCGTTVSKCVSEYDKSLRYLRQKDILETIKRDSEMEESRKAVIKMTIFLICAIVFGIIAHYLKI